MCKEDSRADEAHLSQLSQLNAEKLLSSWLSNPCPEKDLSITEIDQYVTDMISFTKDVLVDVETPRNSFADLVKDDNVRQSVQDIINKIEKATKEGNQCSGSRVSKKMSPSLSTQDVVHNMDERKHEQKSTASMDLSEDDLNHGVFTEVSYAGSFEVPKRSQKKPPMPSPRTKRKARKEQLLMEHKQQGRDVLMKAKDMNKNSKTDNSSAPELECSSKTWDSSGPTEAKPPLNRSASGLDCLDELCSLSRDIERDIFLRQEANVIYSNTQEALGSPTTAAAPAPPPPSSSQALLERQRQELQDLRDFARSQKLADQKSAIEEMHERQFLQTNWPEEKEVGRGFTL